MDNNSLITLTGARVNRKNIAVLPGTLFTGFEQTKNGIPSMYNHDHHRPLGWMIPKALVFDCENTRLMGRLLTPTSESEENKITNLISNYLNLQLVPDDNFRENLLNLLNLLSSDIKRKVEIFNIGQATVAIGDRIVRNEYPELFKKEDADGLIPCNNLEYIGSGVFKYKKVLLFASRKFRRSLSIFNNFNEEFLDFYFKLVGNFEKRIAIDDSTIGLPDSLLIPMELDYWWGPKFDEDIMSIPDGATRHSATSHGLKIILGIDFTDFRWYKNKENKKVFECEEILNIPSCGIDMKSFGSKYCHAIFVNSDKCEHFDGAIRIYDDEQIEKRRTSDIIKFEKHSKYNKIWRIDGEIDKNTFLKLVHYYFRSNTLVSEYFNERNIEHEKQITDQYADSFENLDVPSSKIVGELSSVISSCGFIYKDFDELKPRHFDTQIRIGNDSFSDCSIVDLRKLLKRKQLEFTEEDYEIIAYEDLVCNLPIIYHMGDASFVNAHATLECIKEYIELYANDTDNRLISFTLACQTNIDENEFIYFSFCGCFKYIYELICNFSVLPKTYQDIYDYCNKIDTYLELKKEIFSCTQDYSYFVLDNGTLYIQRNFLPGYSVDNESDPPSFVFPEPIEKEVAFAAVIHDASCSNCGGNYFQCDCIAHELKTKINIIRPELVGFFHTDRKA